MQAHTHARQPLPPSSHTLRRLQIMNCVRTLVCRMLLKSFKILYILSNTSLQVWPKHQKGYCACDLVPPGRPIFSGSITNMFVFPHYSQTEAESFIKGIWGSSRRIYTAQTCPKARGRETSGKGNVKAFISPALSAVPHGHCSFIILFYIFVKMTSSPLFILEINNLNGSPRTFAPFLV